MRTQTITPYVPDRFELGLRSAGDWSTNDIGKPVKLSGDQVTLCADTNEIYGFIRSVELGTKGGHKIMGVGCDSAQEFYGYDETNNMAVGDLAVAGTPVAVGTALSANGPNLKKTAGPVSPQNTWVVMGVSSRKVLVRKF